jgi:hypothetical protein
VFVTVGNVSYTTDYSTFTPISGVPGSSTIAGCTITWTGSQYIYISSSTVDTVYTSGNGVAWAARTITGLGYGRVIGTTFTVDNFISRVPYVNISLGDTTNIFSITKIFGTGVGSTNLSAFYGKSNLEPGPQAPASGSISMSTFAGEMVLQPPSAITITGASTSGGTISWTKPYVSSLSNYTYYIGTASGGSNIVGPATTTSNGSTVSLSFSATLAGNTAYYASVVTRNVSNGVSTVGTSGPLAFPGVPTSVGAPDTAGTFGWVAPITAPTKYTITSYSNGSIYGAATTISAPATSYTGLSMNVAGNQYYYTISASNAVGASPNATSVFRNNVPGAASGLGLTAAGLASWTAPYSYTTRSNTINMFTNGTATPTDLGDVASYQASAFATGTSNYFTIQVSNSGGGGGSSISSNVLIAPNTPAPSLNSAGLASWSAITNASNYSVSLNGGTATIVTATSNQYTLSANTSYTVGVIANSPGGSSSTGPSPTVITVPDLTGVGVSVASTFAGTYSIFVISNYNWTALWRLPSGGNQQISTNYTVATDYSSNVGSVGAGSQASYQTASGQVYTFRGFPITINLVFSNPAGSSSTFTQTFAAGGPPDAPTGLTWTGGPDPNAATWPNSWTVPAGQPTSYRVDYYIASGFAPNTTYTYRFAVLTTTNSDGNTSSNNFQPSDKSAAFTVTASNASGFGPTSGYSTYAFINN